MTPVAAMVVVMPPAVMAVAPVAAVMAPMAVMVVAMGPVAGMVAVAEMVVLPLHGVDRRIGRQRRGRRGRQRGGFGGTGEQAAGHQGQGGKCDTAAPCRGSVGHALISVPPADAAGSEVKARRRRMNGF